MATSSPVKSEGPQAYQGYRNLVSSPPTASNSATARSTRLTDDRGLSAAWSGIPSQSLDLSQGTNMSTMAAIPPNMYHQSPQQSYQYGVAGSSAGPNSSPMPSSASSFGGFSNQQFQHQQQPMTQHPGLATAFASHRRTETAPNMSTSQMGFYSSPSVGMKSEEPQSYSHQQQQQPVYSGQVYGYPTQAPVAVTTSRSSSLGPLRVHQFFPTTGETGVPVTFLITVKAHWAREVGLMLADGRYGGTNGSRQSSHFVISFGHVDVHTRTERSMAGIDSPIASSFAESQTLGRDLDLTVIAHVPTYPGSPLSQPQQGGRVPLRIKLVGAALDPSLHPLSVGFEIGEFCYWEVSPRSNLKRAGEHLFEEPALRRPASTPSLATAQGGPASLDSKRSYQQLQQRRPAAQLERQPVGSRHQRNFTADQSLSNEMAFNFSNSANITSPPSNIRPAVHAYHRPTQSYGPEMGQAHQRQSSFESAHPQLIRSSQLYHSSESSAPSISTSTVPSVPYDNHSSSNSSNNSPPETNRNLSPRASLEIHGNLQDMALGWTNQEYNLGRRLVQFWRKQEGATIHAVCKPILPEQYIPNSIVVSCIYWEVTNECYITSVDIIYLLEALVASRFTVEEKNRIRRNLEGLKPKTISKVGKNNDERINQVHEHFFKLVMGFPDPRPRHIEKDIKIFPWRVLASALNKIISKYSAAPANATPQGQSMAAASTLQAPVSESSTFPPRISQPSFQHPNAYGQGGSFNSSGHSTDMSPPDVKRTQGAGGLSIDVNASNSVYNTMQQQQQHQHSAPSSSSQQLSASSSFPLSSASPRRPLGSSGGGAAMFNFSDFVVSPSAFGQTPLQQSQHGQGNNFYGSSSQQQQSDASASGTSTGLGMDLGLARRD